MDMAMATGPLDGDTWQEAQQHPGGPINGACGWAWWFTQAHGEAVPLVPRSPSLMSTVGSGGKKSLPTCGHRGRQAEPAIEAQRRAAHSHKATSQPTPCQAATTASAPACSRAHSRPP